MTVSRNPAAFRLADLPLTDRQLAQRARTALGLAGGGLLVFGMPGTSLLRPTRTEFRELGGEAHFECAPGGLVDRASAARRSALLWVDQVPEANLRLRLSGRLMAAAPADNAEARVPVWLSVEQVTAFCPHPIGARQDQGRVIPLEFYATAQPDPLLVGARRVLRHLNAEHEPALRRLAARCAGVPAGQVAAAVVRRLDRCGWTLTWVGPGGASDLSLDFTRPADTIGELTVQLSSYFTAAKRPA